MKKSHGFTLIELLVVIAIIGILAAILIPNLMAVIGGAGRAPDRDNLQQMARAYLSQSTGEDRKRRPQSSGHEFWLALFVGDGPDGRLKVTEAREAYLEPSAANLLRSPGDDEIRDRGEIERAIRDAIQSGNGVDHISENIYFVSYAGPIHPVRTSFSRSSGPIGVTGSRDQEGFFEAGFNGVDKDGNAQWYAYSELEEHWNYPSNSTAPRYGEEPLEFVEDYEAAQ